MRKEEEIIDKLLKDTQNNRLHWYDDNENGCIYCRIRNNSSPNNKIDILMRLSENIFTTFASVKPKHPTNRTS